MSEENQKDISPESLIANAKGIWPLIISVFLIVIYLVVSVIVYFISYKYGRI